MNNKEALVLAKAKLDLMLEGFDKIAGQIVFGCTNGFYGKFEPFVLAIREQQGIVEYLRKEVENEEAKAE